jgi:hypothetical protein
VSAVTGLAKALLTNPGVRRVIAKNAARAVTSASSAIGSRGGKDSSAPGAKEPSFLANPIDAVSKTLVTSVAKPMAEKLAKTDAGRSLLETIHSVSGDALGKTSKRPEGALNAVIKLARAAASAAAASQAQPRPTANRPRPSSNPPWEPAVKWPRPFSSAEPDGRTQNGNS